METLYRVLEIINWVCIGLTTIGLVWQLIFIIFSFLKPKHFKKANKQNRFAIIIPAHNEAEVVGRTVKELLTKQDYPRELYDVFVCADNCTDDTAKIAREAGAIVYERFESDPKKKRAAYPIKLLMEKIFEEHDHYDAFIKFDADNLACPDYINRMNDALEEGCEIARAYEASTNFGQNVWTSVSACYYVRDSRIACNFRERAHMNSMLSGAGMMVSAKVIREIGGWDAMGGIDDAEFAVRRMLENRKCHYVADAVVYEDQPSTFKDTFNRNSRMGHALNLLFWSKGFKLLGKTFTKFNISYFDMFCQLMFVPISLLCCIWFPAYYIFYFLVHFIQCFGVEIIPSLYSVGWGGTSAAALVNLGFMIIYVLGVFYLIYTFQSFVAVYTDRKKLGLEKSLKPAYPGIFLSAIFMVIYAIAVSIGICTKPKWNKIKRNVIEEKPETK